MIGRVRSFLLLFVLVVAVAGVAGPAAAADSPTVAVTVARETVDDGGMVTVRSDPNLDINASVPPDATANRTIDEIIVSVNGDRNIYDVDARSVTKTTTPSLSEGNNTVRVLVTDSDGRATSSEFTVRKDSTAPHVFLTEPYETKPFYDITGGNVSGGSVTIAGEFIEETSVRSTSIAYENGNYSGVESFDSPEGNFSTTVQLPRGANRLKITATDELGNSRFYRFNVTVNDAGPPNLTIQTNNETTGTDVEIVGTATDDLWVQSVKATVEQSDGNNTRSKTVVDSKSYDETVDRRETSFDSSLLLVDAGTYDVTVNATDADGNSVSEGFTITRSYPEQNVAPNLTLDEEGTVYVNGGTVLVQGTVSDGEITRVDIESQHAANRSSIAFETVHSGETTESVDIARQIDVGSGVSKIEVHATDSDGTVHTESFYVDADARETFVGPTGATPEPDGPAVSVTSLSDGEPTTASATVSVSDATVGESVTMPPFGGDREAISSTANVTVSEIELTAATSNYTLYVRTDENAETNLSAIDARAIGSVSVDHSPNVSRGNVTVEFRVNDSYLAMSEVDPANVSLYRYADGNWSELSTTHEYRDGDEQVFSAVSPGLSLFAVGTAEENVTAATNDTAGTNDEAASETASDQTNADQSGDDSDASGGGESAGASPEIVVTEVETNTTRISPNGTVLVTATLENNGAANGTYVAGLSLNGSTVDTQMVRVVANESTEATFERRVAETGNYSVLVNGTSGGYLVVGKRGLLGSIWATVTGFVPAWLGGPFAGLPLGLIAQAVGGLLAVIAVAAVLLRVVKRVRGGEGESS